MKLSARLFIALQHILPQHFLSRMMWRLTRFEYKWLLKLTLPLFIRLFKVNMEEAKDPDWKSYTSFNNFFTRELKEDAREISTDENTITSPVDGAVSQFGKIKTDLIFQAKGHAYSLTQLLGDREDLSKTFKNGEFNTIYLSPKDYHRIHMPVDGTLKEMIHVPGQLYSVNPTTVENVPVYIQPGQTPGVIGLALGYGRNAGVSDNMKVGVNAYPLSQNFNTTQAVSIEKVEGKHEFACIQLQHTLMGRDEIIRETTLDDFINKPKKDWNPAPHVQMDHQDVALEKVDLWDKFDDSLGPKFNLSIDLAGCTGCGACVVACHAENNVPVVGKEEIRKSRDMHWLRIDRYYSSDMTEERGIEEGIFGSGEFFNAQTHPSDNPDVTFQPVMCMHCNHAPCETVCPVAATSHGRQGQNQMAYNRCVGTRYCANNCPYKVRRFNWFLYTDNEEFDYHMNNDLGRMVLNPDVVVRSRGVMEKCSMCIQMTQKTILDAKNEGRSIKDGEFKTACSSACESGAMVFGDVNDHESEVNKLSKDKRMYHLLEAVGTKPNVLYQVKVRNSEEV